MSRWIGALTTPVFKSRLSPRHHRGDGSSLVDMTPIIIIAIFTWHQDETVAWLWGRRTTPFLAACWRRNVEHEPILVNKQEFEYFLAQCVFVRGHIMVGVRYDTGLEHYSEVYKVQSVFHL